MKTISIRLSEELKKELERKAKEDNRSVNSYVVQAIVDKNKAIK